MLALLKKKRHKKMNPVPAISIVRKTDKLTDDQCRIIVRAISIQLSRDVAPIYGATPAIEFAPEGQLNMTSDGAAPCYLEDQSDIPGALGYHDEDSSGQPFIKVFVGTILDSGGTVMEGSNSVSVTISHEILELIGDPSANLWADGPDGFDYARELCDAVEGDSYDIHGASVSNFLYPAFFDPQASKNSKLDFLGKLSQPFSMTPGGYQIKRGEPGKISQVFGDNICAEVITPRVVLDFGPDFPKERRNAKITRTFLKGRAKYFDERETQDTLGPTEGSGE